MSEGVVETPRLSVWIHTDEQIVPERLQKKNRF